ncbi:MAG: peptidoglycan-binding domain-containing protein [Stellaceae bacterium]
MSKLIRKVVLGTASVLALGVGGAAIDSALDPGNVANAGSMPSASEISGNSLPDTRMWKDDVRWAQAELRNDRLYNGSLDGVLGPQTKRALKAFQRDNGLDRTASLDAPTWTALTGHAEIGQGSSTEPSAASSFGTSASGR